MTSQAEFERRARWLRATRDLAAAENVVVECPENRDGVLLVEWIPAPAGTGGEYYVRCPACGVEDYLPVTRRAGGDDTTR